MSLNSPPPTPSTDLSLLTVLCPRQNGRDNNSSDNLLQRTSRPRLSHHAVRPFVEMEETATPTSMGRDVPVS